MAEGNSKQNPPETQVKKYPYMEKRLAYNAKVIERMSMKMEEEEKKKKEKENKFKEDKKEFDKFIQCCLSFASIIIDMEKSPWRKNTSIWNYFKKNGIYGIGQKQRKVIKYLSLLFKNKKIHYKFTLNTLAKRYGTDSGRISKITNVIEAHELIIKIMYKTKGHFKNVKPLCTMLFPSFPKLEKILFNYLTHNNYDFTFNSNEFPFTLVSKIEYDKVFIHALNYIVCQDNIEDFKTYVGEN